MGRRDILYSKEILAAMSQLCVTHLHDGVLKVIEVDWFEALELRVPTTQIVEQRRQRLAVVVNMVNNDSHSLHEPQRVTFELWVTH